MLLHSVSAVPTSDAVLAPTSHQLVSISKKMTFALRHQPPSGMDNYGWVTVAELADHVRTTRDVVTYIASNDSKGRYVIDLSQGRIRAAQGHSIAIQDTLLVRVTAATQIAWAIHVTSPEAWAAIQECGQLQRMRRTHIHFATQAKHIRRDPWATVPLALNIAKALQHGVALYLAPNGVLLTEGPVDCKEFITALPQLPVGWQ